MKDTFKNEFFECDCGDRDDLIIAHKELWRFGEKDENTEIDITLEMITSKGDWESFSFKSWNNIFIRFFQKLIWRVKEAIKILFIGKVIVRGYWMPCRTESDNDSIRLTGVENTRKLGEWLINAAKEAEEFYKDTKGNK
jgi:hypothetical protein